MGKILLMPKDLRLMEKMGENIKLARLRRKLGSTQVSERAGIARSTLYQIEKGDPGVAIGNYLKVLKTVNLSGDLFNLAANDELGRKLQDLELLNKDEKELTLSKESRKIFDSIRMGLLKEKFNSDLEQIVGLSALELKNYLNNNQYGFKISDDYIDIDHIVPLNDIKTIEQVENLNNYTNLQLLPREYNRNIKGTNKWDKNHFLKWYENI